MRRGRSPESALRYANALYSRQQRRTVHRYRPSFALPGRGGRHYPRPEDIADYQKSRLKAGASPKTIDLEAGTLRAILRRHRLWATMQPDVRMMPVHEAVGRCLTEEEERRLLDACRGRRSRALLPVVTLALHTGMRRGEIQSLRWNQIDFLNGT